MPTGDGPNDAGRSRQHLIAECEASLRRLGTDHIDLYQVHEWDGQTPLEETLDALDTLVRSGKIRYVGCSNYAAWQLMKALGTADRRGWQRFVSQQIYYSLQAREAEYELVPVTLDQGLAILVWSPLAGGLLSGKYRRGRPGPEGARQLTDWNEPPVRDREALYDVVEALAEIGDGHAVSAAQVALAWLRDRPGVTSLIIGARTEEQLADNLAAADLKLSSDERERLEALSRPPLLYPYWRQAKTAADRLAPADLRCSDHTWPSIRRIDGRDSLPYVRDSGTWLAYGLILHFGFLQAVLGPVVPYLRRELDLGYTVASFHVAALAIGSVIGALASRRVERATSRRELVALGVTGMAAGGVCLAATPTLVGTIGASLLMGVSGTLSLVGAQAALADRHGERRAVALGEANVAASLGAFSVPLIVAAGEATGLSWRLALAVGALIGALLAWCVRATGVHEPRAVARARSVSSLPAAARIALALVFCVVCVEWSVGFWGASFADDQVGLSTDAAVTLSTLFFAAMLAGRLAGSALARRVAVERLVAVGLAVAFAGFPLLWLADDAFAAGAGLVLIGLGVAALFPLSAAITFAAAPGLTTLASGRAVTAGAAAILSAPLILGQLADAGGLRLAFGVVPVFLAMAAGALALVVRRPRPVPVVS